MHDESDSGGEPVLDLLLLGKGQPNLTPARGEGFAEAAAVCFEKAGHLEGKAIMATRGIVDGRWLTIWPAVTEQMRRTYNDIPEATEEGAYGLAILIVRAISGLTVVERSAKGTGFDYWLGEGTAYPFQNKARLEASGLLRGTSAQLNARVKQKENQTRLSDKTRLPAYVVVVEYGEPQARVSKR